MREPASQGREPWQADGDYWYSYLIILERRGFDLIGLSDGIENSNRLAVNAWQKPDTLVKVRGIVFN